MSKVSSNNSWHSVYKSHKAKLIFILQLGMGKNLCCGIKHPISLMTLAVVLAVSYTARWIISLFFVPSGLISLSYARQVGRKLPHMLRKDNCSQS